MMGGKVTTQTCSLYFRPSWWEARYEPKHAVCTSNHHDGRQGMNPNMLFVLRTIMMGGTKMLFVPWTIVMSGKLLMWLCDSNLSKDDIFTTYTHTIVLLLFWNLSRSTRVSRYQKGKTNLDLLEQEMVSGSGICWAICKSAPHPRQPHQHPTTQFLQAGCPSWMMRL